MKKVISSIFVLFALAIGVSASDAFADHAEVIVTPVPGSGFPGCEETDEGCYDPMVATVDVGGKVIFSNTDVVVHVFAAGTIKEPTGEFNSGLVSPGASHEWTPTEVGEVQHFCQVHPWMSGTIIVQAVGMDDKMMGDDKMMDSMGDSMMGDNMDHDSMDMSDIEISEEDISGTGMLPDGTTLLLAVKETSMGERAMISVMFVDSEHVNYDIMAMQGETEVLSDTDAHSHTGMGDHMTAPLEADLKDAPLDITIMFNGYGVDEITGETGEVKFTNVVPEFGTIAMLILAVAVISVVVVTSKSRVIPRL